MAEQQRRVQQETRREEPRRENGQPPGQTAMEVFRGDLSKRFPQPRERGQERPIRLIDLPDEMQAQAMRMFGLPDDINRALVIFLGGNPYSTKEALLDLASKRRMVSLETEQLPTRSCVDMGCFSKKVNGYAADGGHYVTWKDALNGLREQYPDVDDQELKRKIYKHFDTEPAESWQRTHLFRAVARFIETDTISLGPGRGAVEKDREVTYAMTADCCPHNATSVTSSALVRMAQSRAVAIVLRAGTKLGPTSAEELPGVLTNEHGQVVGRVVEEEDPRAPRAGFEFTVSEADQAALTELKNGLGVNQGKIEQLLGEQKGDAAAVIKILRAELDKRGQRPATGSVRPAGAATTDRPASDRKEPAKGEWEM